MQTFACQTISGKWMLRAQLSLACDPSSSRRRLWRNWAILNLLMYLIGFPLFLICLMLPQRARIRKNSFLVPCRFVCCCCSHAIPSNQILGELMEEVTRQSSIARRPITLLDLREVQRDSNYQETQLITKLKQGREAGKALCFQRRQPTVVIGFLLQ